MSIIIISFLVIIIEKGIFPSFFPSGFIPQFLLIYLISLTNWQIRNFHTELKWHNIALAIFISGIIYDLLSGNFLGINSLLLLVTIFVIIVLGLILPSQVNFFFLPLSIVVGSIVFNVLFYFSYSILGIDLNLSFWNYIISQNLVNFIMGIISQILFSFLFNKFLSKKDIEIS
ncbi:hypothetical protein A2X44_03030 [candidate division CPR3 bacterium GWF2_35_18]|uniref:Uncharacterized protein n=1 Tax=candidate division CPR3 bacterium GW2011_GWF2_35_18 TaxID=1618350 RepID=A0A0G0BJ07_UNCC3|nr:MAG: hypothetical protein UR67_C0006G0046 [candidate division CPR3 bacterium GW2011_GWF2_35_18]OGB62952.1 MAG: hypothetical protein A2X44_03030 [candidate division CPR3 bacterium GWF2_35_18]OGB65922.1 MAG: hypothetical protein A2250_03360 [candidate division CPR3 bacterium RIFOXYA2_FULL_35_13]OGB75891.1 MAG: hypothetical protein A2476_04650 [candidate division CPR3 bacterium RIFOXYC2_FULL_35_7]OGB79258.1 MAG: hypothetical protein A2296_01075 [candidate division CPR3 bacterium RIFOXYB2_FULL_3